MDVVYDEGCLESGELVSCFNCLLATWYISFVGLFNKFLETETNRSGN